MKTFALTIAGAALTATALSAAPAQAASLSTQTHSAPASTSALAYQPHRTASNAVTYTQAGGTISAHQRGRVIATVRLHSISRHGSYGRLVLDVTSNRPVTIHASHFVWEDKQGGEIAPLNRNRAWLVNGGTRRITLTWRHITAGAVAWIPGNNVAGVWGVG